MINVRSPQSPKEFNQYYEFRWRILREPWGQVRGSEKDALETVAEHVGAYDQYDRLIGIGRLHVKADNSAQLRYMATDPQARGTGVGRLVLESLESIAKKRGIKHVCLNARESATGFYEHLGYRIVAKGPTLFNDIKHLIMEKTL